MSEENKLPKIAELLLRINELEERIHKLEHMQKSKSQVVIRGSSPSAQAYYQAIKNDGGNVDG